MPVRVLESRAEPPGKSTGGLPCRPVDAEYVVLDGLLGNQVDSAGPVRAPGPSGRPFGHVAGDRLGTGVDVGPEPTSPEGSEGPAGCPPANGDSSRAPQPIADDYGRDGRSSRPASRSQSRTASTRLGPSLAGGGPSSIMTLRMTLTSASSAHDELTRETGVRPARPSAQETPTRAMSGAATPSPRRSQHARTARRALARLRRRRGRRPCTSRTTADRRHARSARRCIARFLRTPAYPVDRCESGVPATWQITRFSEPTRGFTKNI